VLENILTVLITLILFSNFDLVHADSLNAGIFSEESTPFGIGYDDWVSKWWNWHVSMSKDTHPRENNEPSRCASNQEGDVWFLADILQGKEERSCTIPEGRAILVPLLTGACWDDNTDPELKTDQGLLKCAKEGDEYSVVSAQLNGVQLKNLQDYRVHTTPFNLTIPEGNNVVESLPGTFRAIADGYFIFLEPLTRGNYELQLKTSVANPVTPDYNYAAEVLYHIKIT
jgi:hypothetical protein